MARKLRDSETIIQLGGSVFPPRVAHIEPHFFKRDVLMNSHFALILTMITAIAWTGTLVYLVRRWSQVRK
jgi:hypothetical protein